MDSGEVVDGSKVWSGRQDAALYGRPEARRYGRVEKIHFEDAHFRRDGAAWGGL